MSKNNSPESKFIRLGKKLPAKKNFSTNLLELNYLLVLLQICLKLSTATCDLRCICNFWSTWLFMGPSLIYLPCSFLEHINMLTKLVQKSYCICFSEFILIVIIVNIQATLKTHKRSRVSVYIPTTPHCSKMGKFNHKF